MSCVKGESPDGTPQGGTVSLRVLGVLRDVRGKIGLSDKGNGQTRVLGDSKVRGWATVTKGSTVH